MIITSFLIHAIICIGNVAGLKIFGVEVKWANGITSKVAPYEIVRVDKHDGAASISVDEEDSVISTVVDVGCKKHLWETASFSLPQAAIGFFTNIAASLLGTLDSNLDPDSTPLVQVPEVQSESKMSNAKNGHVNKGDKQIQEDKDLPHVTKNDNLDKFSQFDMVADCSDHHFLDTGAGFTLSQVRKECQKKLVKEGSSRMEHTREKSPWVHHTHALAKSHEKPFVRSNRKLTEPVREVALLMKRAGIITSHIWQYLVEIYGGWEKVGCIKADLYRGLRNNFRNWDDCDTTTAMGYLQSKKGPDADFFYNHDVDEENRLTNLFWADGSMKVDYELFGDCLCFDATYKTNRATGICESMNAFIKKDLEKGLPLWMFLRHCDNGVAALRYNEMARKLQGEYGDPCPKLTSMPNIEEQAASIFTRKVFNLVKAEIKRGDKYSCSKSEILPNYDLFLVSKYMSNHPKRKVFISHDEEDIRCDCYWFETKGIPCRHIFAS
uniref:SWIM-type domain-containing protein n=1 Tax=Cannabis sativa TaxID=3483 RepID=A0A803NJM1_CANSA